MLTLEQVDSFFGDVACSNRATRKERARGSGLLFWKSGTGCHHARRDYGVCCMCCKLVPAVRITDRNFGRSLHGSIDRQPRGTCFISLHHTLGGADGVAGDCSTAAPACKGASVPCGSFFPLVAARCHIRGPVCNRSHSAPRNLGPNYRPGTIFPTSTGWLSSSDSGTRTTCFDSCWMVPSVPGGFLSVSAVFRHLADRSISSRELVAVLRALV